MVHHNFTCVIQVRATNEEKCKAARILHEVFPHWKVIRPQQELSLQQEEKPLHTYYCLFLPLGIYCGFGAENIHHAYNKAAKHWGARNPINPEYMDNGVIARKGEYTKEHRIAVFNDIKHMSVNNRAVTHTLMTKLVKAWREENS